MITGLPVARQAWLPAERSVAKVLCRLTPQHHHIIHTDLRVEFFLPLAAFVGAVNKLTFHCDLAALLQERRRDVGSGA